MKKLLAVVTFLALFVNACEQGMTAPKKWIYTTRVDEMTGESHFAATLISNNMIDVPAPFTTRQYVIMLLVASKVKNSNLLSHGIEVFIGEGIIERNGMKNKVRVKFDDEPPIYVDTDEYTYSARNSLSFYDDESHTSCERFYGKMLVHKTMKVEISIFDGITQIVTFNIADLKL